MSGHQIASERLERPLGAAKSGLSGSVARCPQCGASFTKKRKHQIFCSAKCRKAFWAKERTARPGYDIRAQLDRIEALVRKAFSPDEKERS